jgi:coenzyme F420 biosynthesis associated uncharacterized protein
VNAIDPRRAQAIKSGLFMLGFAGAYFVASRRQARPGIEPRLVDWERVRSIAATIARRDPLASSYQQLVQSYSDMVGRSQTVIADYTAEPLPLSSGNVYVFDRLAWLDANIANFRLLFEPLETTTARLFGGVGGRPLSELNGLMLSGQMGLLLGYLSRRVLGQYDLAVLGREPVTTGRLYFVEPNIRQVERRLGLEPNDFRLWIALHETTHAYEFEAHPWLREHMNGLLQQYFSTLADDLTNIRTDVGGITSFVRRVGSNIARRDGYAVELVMNEQQRRIFRQLQALMCLLEGYSNHVMDAVGRDILPSYDRMKARFEDRLRKKGPAERLFAKLTGLDVKYEQYVLGERFVNEVVSRVGVRGMNRVWQGKEQLPTLEEIKQPSLWLSRVA